MRTTEQTQQKADWLAWWIQLVCGFLAGAAVSCLVCMRIGWMLANDGRLIIVPGVGLIVGAVATHYGDRLWMKGRYSRILPPDEVEVSNASRICSVLIGLAGAGLMIYAILRTMKAI